jgi:hypothetical protein
MEPHRDTELNIETRVVQSGDFDDQKWAKRLKNRAFRDIII